MVLALTHPDYAADPRMAAGYRSLLEGFHGDPMVWHALPREVATWWRQRACSVIRGAGDTWRIEGPASASGQIQFARAGSPRGPARVGGGAVPRGQIPTLPARFS